MKSKDKIYIALDFDNYRDACNLAMRLKDIINNFKIGLELFTKCGPDIVSDLKDSGCNVFLDLKLHDINNTTISTLKVINSLEVDIVNMHLMNSYENISNIVEMMYNDCLSKNLSPAMLVGVSVLTSISEQQLRDDLLISMPLPDYVLHLAKIARKAGLNGIVCSPLEASMVKKELGGSFTIITPGIRPSNSDQNDQKRTTTPKKAIMNGSDILVIGRPITTSSDPEQTCVNILKELDDI